MKKSEHVDGGEILNILLKILLVNSNAFREYTTAFL